MLLSKAISRELILQGDNQSSIPIKNMNKDQSYLKVRDPITSNDILIVKVKLEILMKESLRKKNKTVALHF